MKEKIIKLHSEEDIKEFEKNIWKYRSIFYKRTHFTLENKTNDDGYNIIIEALNIKKRYKRISYIYDKACEQIDNYNKENNIECEFKEGKCLAHYNTKHHNGCCRVCKYQSQTGCKTQNLACKLFFCGCVKKKYKTLNFEDVKILKCLPKKSQIMLEGMFFINRKNFIFVLYTNSFIVLAIVQLGAILNMIGSYKIEKKHYK